MKNINKDLLRTIGVLGRETKGTKNEPLFYIYDGTVEKNIPEENAVTALINLIKKHGDWVEKN